MAIVDLVTGDPPITNEDGTIGVALNGEIYNFRSLRDELMRSGHRLSTAGDTEVIAHLAEYHEPADLARRLEGMFAFALWDERRRRLILGRDRLGKKPLYVWAGEGRFVFASEIKAVLAHPWVPRELDEEAIPAYLTFGYVPTPRTFYGGIHSVPPASVLTFDSTGTISVERYWAPPYLNGAPIEPLDLPLADAADEVRRVLTESVRRRLIADVPIGAFLSGGVDSSAVVAIMAELSPRPVMTFTIGFEDTEGYDERPYARAVADRYRTDHTEFVVNPSAVDLVERLVWHHDQPFGDASAIPSYLLCELTRKEVKVALCGDGGDELFAGYQRFAAALILARYQRLPGAVQQAIRAAAALIPGGTRRGSAASLRRFIQRSTLPVPDAYLAWVSYFQTDQRSELGCDSPDWATEDYHRIWNSAGSSTPLLDRILLVNLRTYLLDDLLPKMDRMSMAHGLEVRSPYLDRELVEHAFRLPPHLRVRKMEGKLVLKRAVRDLLPPELLSRRKQGFAVPLDRWFRSELKPLVDMTLGSGDSRVRRKLRASAVDRLIAQHTSGSANHGLLLWALLTLEMFLRREDW